MGDEKYYLFNITNNYNQKISAQAFPQCNSQYLADYNKESYIMPQPKILTINEINKIYKDWKEFRKNYFDYQANSNFTLNYSILSQSMILPLSFSYEDSMYGFFDEIKNEINYLMYGTIHSPTCVLLPFLTAVAATTQGKVKIVVDRNKDWYEWLNIYSIQFADSGTRKSLVYEKLKAPFEEFENSNYREVGESEKKDTQKFMKLVKKRMMNDLLKDKDLRNIDDIVNTCKEYLAYNSELESSLEIEDTFKRILISKYTYSGLIKFLKNNNCFCAFLDAESDHFFRNIEKTRDELLKLYTHESICYDNYNKSYVLKSPSACISIYGHLNMIKNFHLKKEYIEDGLVGRFMPWLTNKGRISQNTYEPNTKDIYSQKMKHLISMFATSEEKTLGIDLAAQNYIYSFLENNKDWIEYRCNQRSWRAKFIGNAIRIAAALHVYRNYKDPCSSYVNTEEIIFAINTALKCNDHFEFLISRIGYQAYVNACKIIESYDKPNDYILNLKIHDPAQGICTRDICQRTHFCKEDVNNALAYLALRNRVCLGDDGSGNFKVAFHPNFAVKDENLKNQFF